MAQIKQSSLLLGANQTYMDYFNRIQPWIMDNKKVKVEEDNDHLGLSYMTHITMN